MHWKIIINISFLPQESVIFRKNITENIAKSKALILFYLIIMFLINKINNKNILDKIKDKDWVYSTK